MALIVLDASVVIAHLDASDAHHHAAVSKLRSLATDDLRLPASAYSEALVGPTRRGDPEQARARIQALPLRIEPISADQAEAAALLRAGDPPLRLPDALVIACGEVIGADRVVTTDRRWQRFGRLIEVIG